MPCVVLYNMSYDSMSSGFILSGKYLHLLIVGSEITCMYQIIQYTLVCKQQNRKSKSEASSSFSTEGVIKCQNHQYNKAKVLLNAPIPVPQCLAVRNSFHPGNMIRTSPIGTSPTSPIGTSPTSPIGISPTSPTSPINTYAKK